MCFLILCPRLHFERVGTRGQLGGAEITATVSTLSSNSICLVGVSVHRNCYPPIAVCGVVSSAPGEAVKWDAKATSLAVRLLWVQILAVQGSCVTLDRLLCLSVLVFSSVKW